MDQNDLLMMALKGQPQPSSGLEVAKALGKAAFPAISNYLTAERPPPATVPNAAGKLPSSDPYLGPAIGEASDTAMMAMPGGSNILKAILGVGTAAAADSNRVAARSPSSTPTDTAGPPPGLVSMRPKFTQEDSSRLNQLDREIKDLTTTKQNAINSVGRSRIGPTAASYDTQIQSKQDEIKKMRDDMLNKQSEFDHSTLPLVASQPDLVSKGRLGMMGLSGLTGMVNALGGKGLPKSLAYGGLEGGFGVLAPTLYDLQQPQGTAAKDVADKNVGFMTHPTESGAWDWARNTLAPEAAGGAALGAIGHGVGSSIRGLGGAVSSGIRGLFGKTPSQSLPSSLPPEAPPILQARPGGKIWPTDPKQINMMKDSTGRWREQGTGHYIPKHLQPSK